MRQPDHHHLLTGHVCKAWQQVQRNGLLLPAIPSSCWCCTPPMPPAHGEGNTNEWINFVFNEEQQARRRSVQRCPLCSPKPKLSLWGLGSALAGRRRYGPVPESGTSSATFSDETASEASRFLPKQLPLSGPCQIKWAPMHQTPILCQSRGVLVTMWCKPVLVCRYCAAGSLQACGAMKPCVSHHKAAAPPTAAVRSSSLRCSIESSLIHAAAPAHLRACCCALGATRAPPDAATPGGTPAACQHVQREPFINELQPRPNVLSSAYCFHVSVQVKHRSSPGSSLCSLGCAADRAVRAGSLQRRLATHPAHRNRPTGFEACWISSYSNVG